MIVELFFILILLMLFVLCVGYGLAAIKETFFYESNDFTKAEKTDD